MIEMGENYIWDNIDSLRNDSFEMMGFELIFPTLLKEAEKMGLNLPYHKNHYEAIREKKLKLIPEEYIYSNKTPTTHSIEFLGEEVDANRLINAQSENGSMLNSPSATAFFYRTVADSERKKKAYEYIRYGILLDK